MDTYFSQRDSGRFVVGGRRQITAATSVFGENTYDMFGPRQQPTSTTGIDVAATEALSYGGSYTKGLISDDMNGDLTRQAISLTATYDSDTLKARTRLEYRRDQEFAASGRANTDTTLVSSDAQWKITDSQRLLFSLASSRTTNDTNSLLGGSFTEASIGYAYRPLIDGRANILTCFRYLNDSFGQTIDGVAGVGPTQDSHILTLEGNYDVTNEWTLGAKLGHGASLSAPVPGGKWCRTMPIWRSSMRAITCSKTGTCWSRRGISRR